MVEVVRNSSPQQSLSRRWIATVGIGERFEFPTGRTYKGSLPKVVIDVAIKNQLTAELVFMGVGQLETPMLRKASQKMV